MAYLTFFHPALLGSYHCVMVTTLRNTAFGAEARAAGREHRAFPVQPKGEDLQEMTDRLAAGELRIAVARSFPLADAAQIQTLLETSHAAGKIVLEP